MRILASWMIVCAVGAVAGMAVAENAKAYKDADVKAFKKLYEKRNEQPPEKQAYLLDVRTEAEYVVGHLPGAQLIPVQELEARVKEITASKNASVLVYCRSGARSVRASEILVSNGFKDVTNMLGGFIAWSAAQYPSETGKPKPPTKPDSIPESPKEADAPQTSPVPGKSHEAQPE